MWQTLLYMGSAGVLSRALIWLSYSQLSNDFGNFFLVVGVWGVTLETEPKAQCRPCPTTTQEREPVAKPGS